MFLLRFLTPLTLVVNFPSYFLHSSEIRTFASLKVIFRSFTMSKFLDANWKNKKVLIRVDFNVPFDENMTITDDTRIQMAIPTIQHIVLNGGIAILVTHVGRPKEREEKLSTKHLLSGIQKYLSNPLIHCSEVIGEKPLQMVSELSSGSILLLENVRYHKEETAGDAEFAKSLAALCDAYVNDAFGTAHRAHASTTIVAQYVKESYFGLLMEKEVLSIENVLGTPKKPFTAIIGGAKVGSKIGILKNLLAKVDTLIIAGGMTYTFLKAQGGNVGNSLVEDDKLSLALDILEEAKKRGIMICFAEDSVLADSFSNEASISTSLSKEIPDGLMGLDIGENARKAFRKVLLSSKTILWNGPIGVFEFENFSEGTKAIAEAVAEATKNGAFSLVGGGDSVAAIKQLGMAEKMSYVSTGGGALLEMIEGKILPGIDAIKR